MIRVDASIEMGTGHVMRCLTLAEWLREQGTEVSFISRLKTGSLNRWIEEEKGFSVYSLPPNEISDYIDNQDVPLYERWLGVSIEQDAYETRQILVQQEKKPEWLIVDHYALDAGWEKEMRPYVQNIMVIDDLANRPHDCDVLLDQNVHVNTSERYNGLVPSHCMKLLGPQYALLRKEFIEARKTVQKRDGMVRRLFVFFGGSDPTNETMKVLDAWESLQRSDIKVDVVVGNSNPNREQVKQRCGQLTNVRYHCQINNIAQLMARADLAIGAGGATTWERCAVGLPALVVAVADNQEEIAKAVSKTGATLYLGRYDQVGCNTIVSAVGNLLSNPKQISFMRKKSMDIVGCKFRNELYNLFS